LKTKIANVAKKVFEKASEQEFKGYDPFDGLNSQVFNAFPSFKNSLIGLAWTQVFKRSPINFRPFSGVPRARNPKGIGLFILGLVLDYRLSGNTEYLNKAIDLAEWLDTQKCDLDTWQYACWGYHFDWKARAFFVPKGKPNVITTIYVAQALYELSQVIDTIDRSKSERYRKLR